MTDKAAKKPTSSPAALEVVSKNLDTAMDHLRAYRARQDAIVLGLGEVRRAIEGGYLPTAKDAIDELLGMTLKQSKDRVDNLLLALKIAVDALEAAKDRAPLKACSSEIQDALSQIELVAPKEFKTFQVPAAGAAS